MITPRVQIEEGPRIDDFLSSIKITANYLECSTCGLVKEISVLDIATITEWQSNPKDLKPSKFFRTIRGTCPTCRKTKSLFKGATFLQ